MIIALVGMPASGKGEASKVLEKAGFAVVRMRDAVWAELGANGLEATPGNVGDVANSMRELDGPAAVAKRTLPAVQAAGERVCIEGVRSKAEVDFFKESLEEFVCIGITAPPEKRYQWAVERARDDDAPNFEEFQKKDEREAGWGVDAALESADYVVENCAGLEEFQAKIQELLGKILGEKILKGDEI